jgi:hypothetical protein
MLVDKGFTNFRQTAGDGHGMGAVMEPNSGKASRAGGFIIAVTIMAGALLGARYGQPSLGIVIGTGIGVAMALGLYLYDRRKA